MSSLPRFQKGDRVQYTVAASAWWETERRVGVVVRQSILGRFHLSRYDVVVRWNGDTFNSVAYSLTLEHVGGPR